MQTANETSAKEGIKKKKKSLTLWHMILLVIGIVYLLSFIIPSGSYQYDGSVAIAGTFEIVSKTYLTPFDVILSVGETVYNTFGELFITLMIMGGMMGIINSTGVLDRGLSNMIYRLKDKALIIIPFYVFATGLLGCIGSMISSVILFVPLGLSVAKQLKADRAFGVALIILGSFTGFMSSPVNPLTCVLGQEIAGLTPYSGSGLRALVTVINLSIVSAYLVWWVKRCQQHPERCIAPFAEDETLDALERTKETYVPLKSNEVLLICMLFGSFFFFAAGGAALGLNTLAVGSVMLPIAIIEGFIAKLDLEETMERFVKGTQDMCGVMIFMMLATVMSVILSQSGILDTIVYGISIPLSGLSSAFAAIGMFGANALINIFINSGSGQTVVMMPIMAPLADVVNVSRQMAVLALQYGDGFTNMFSPTSVNLMACLALAKVEFKQWIKFLVPCYGVLAIVMIASIFIGTAIGF